MDEFPITMSMHFHTNPINDTYYAYIQSTPDFTVTFVDEENDEPVVASFNEMDLIVQSWQSSADFFADIEIVAFCLYMDPERSIARNNLRWSAILDPLLDYYQLFFAELVEYVDG